MNNYFTETSKANMSLLNAVSFHEIELQVYLKDREIKSTTGTIIFSDFQGDRKKKTANSLRSYLPPTAPRSTQIYTQICIYKYVLFVCVCSCQELVKTVNKF